MSLSPTPPYPPRRASIQPEPLGRPERDDLLTLRHLRQPLPTLLYVGPAGRACFERAGETPPPGDVCVGIFAAHCRLYQLQQQGRTPAAILCEPTLPDGTALRWRELLAQDPDLRAIPFVVVGDPEEWPERLLAHAKGIDECLPWDVDPFDLRQRLTFLQQHKADLLAYQGAPPAPQLPRLSPLKRLTDLIIAALALLLLAPGLLFLVFWLRMRGNGPIFVKLPRIGRGYRLIHCWAFRGGDQEGAAAWHQVPRLWNVLRGDLSLVGNRPLPLPEAGRLTTDQWAGRFLAPAGLTGPWRFSPAQPTDDTQTRDLELAYAQQPGLGKDLYWLGRTLGSLLLALGRG